MSAIKKNTFKSRLWFRRIVFIRFTGLFLVIVFAMGGISQAAQTVRMRQKTFATPEKAVESLVAANKNNNNSELLKILGRDSGDLIFSGAPVADKRGRERFVQAYDAMHKLESNGDDKRILVVGKEEWPLPIPIVREGMEWHFDTKTGAKEILNRRIGRNELNVMSVCRAFVEAQREFARKKPRVDGKPEYAQRFNSTRGKHDGLYWQAKPGEEESPLGPFIAAAEAEGYGERAVLARRPYHGYYYWILTAQGDKASGGARNYITGNRMTKGFALIAFPAKYGNSGVMTFIVNQDGIVHEKNLGPNTTKIARQITQYNPDATWKMP